MTKNLKEKRKKPANSTPISGLGELRVDLLKPKQVTTKKISNTKNQRSKNEFKNQKAEPRHQSSQQPEVCRSPRKQKAPKKVIRFPISDSETATNDERV